MVLSYNGFFEPLKLDRLDEVCSNCLAQFNSAAQLDLESSNLRQTQGFIPARQAPAAPTVPVPVAMMPTAGCKTFRWNGQMGITDLLQAAKRGIASPLCHRRKSVRQSIDSD